MSPAQLLLLPITSTPQPDPYAPNVAGATLATDIDLDASARPSCPNVAGATLATAIDLDA
eukprot:2808044-Pleurochrysis_carterae.AAC.1